MPVIAQLPRSGGGDFTPLSAGYHDGVFKSVEVKTFDQKNFNTGAPEKVDKLVIDFESHTDPPVDGKPAIGKMFVRLAYGDRAHLTILRSRLLGRNPSGDEAYDISSEEFEGKKVKVLVKQRTSRQGRLYADLDPTSVTPMGDGATPQASEAVEAVTKALDGEQVEDSQDIPF
jgi:hypothetical protein